MKGEGWEGRGGEKGGRGKDIPLTQIP